MDDLLVIILTLIIAVVGALSQIKKKRQQTQPKANSPNRESNNIWNILRHDGQYRVLFLQEKQNRRRLLCGWAKYQQMAYWPVGRGYGCRRRFFHWTRRPWLHHGPGRLLVQAQALLPQLALSLSGPGVARLPA